MKIKKLVTNAMLVAMYVVLSLTVTLNLGNMKITFDSLPIILGAALFGPMDGFIIGFLGSFLNQMLTFGLTATTVLWVLPAAVRGLLVGLYAKKKGFSMSFKQTVFITASTALVTTAINTLVMYIDAKIYGYYSFAYVFGAVIPRIITGVIVAVVISSILPYVLQPVRKILGLKTAKKAEKDPWEDK